MKKKDNLKSFTLFGIDTLGDQKGKSLAILMKECKSIETLVLKEINLNSEDAPLIAKMLSLYSSSLKFLDLSGNFFHKELSAVLDSFKNNNSIVSIRLQKMNLTEKPFMHLLQAIKNSSSLTELDVSNNSIKSGVEHFKSVAEDLKKLEILQLNNCEIDDSSFVLLVGGLKLNKSLKTMELNNNKLTEKSGTHIKDLLDNAKTIEYLYILQNKVRMRDLINILDNSSYSKVIGEL